ncbi:MAG: ornithine cyclodeaminase family protein [Deltaproteobacteria bacterium]|nr:MAG: ornithine cyclodeaminase family protein [Deltaproteobacteria bacterium]
MTLVLNDDDVANVLSMKDCIAALEDAFREMGLGNVMNAPRRDSFMVSSRSDAYYSFKTIEGGLEGLGVVAQRINSDLITHPVIDGVARRVKVPAAPGTRYVGLVFLYSAETLELLAIITDGHLQRMRVAGSTGVGVKYLAREDSHIAALLGSGWQAEAAAWALASVRPLSTIKVFSPNAEHRKSFAQKMAADLDIEVIPAGSAEEAVNKADIVACATNSAGAVVKGGWIGKGMHLTTIRVHELDEEAWRRSDLITFSGHGGSGGYFTYATQRFEAGHRVVERKGERGDLENEWFTRYRNKIHFLCDVLTDKAPRRTNPSQITLMNKNWGLGIEFTSVAKLIYDRARDAGLGKEIPTEWFSQTSHP